MEKIHMELPALVAVYGSLRKGFGNSYHLDGANFLGECKTNAECTLYSLGYFPGLTFEGDTEVVLEVYQVSDRGMANSLDSLEGYPHFYNRKQIDTIYGKAWVYYMEPSDRYIQSGTKVESGDWAEFKKINEEVE